LNKKLQNLVYGYTQSANNDIEIIETLFQKRNNILIFYHIQQAFEKLLKVLYLQTSTYEPELKIKKIFNFRHEIEDITLDLIILTCDEYIIQYKSFENISTKDYDKFVKQIESYKNTTKTEKENMKINFKKNIENYSSFIDKIYGNFTKYHTPLQENPQGKIILILVVGLLLSTCLYKMNNLSRYPDEDFNFENLDLLKDNLISIPKIFEMFQFWINLIK
jgi:HEPN domain-containing protein